MRFGVCRREPYRVQVRRDIALRWRRTLDFENRSRITEKFRVAYAALFRNVDAKVKPKPFDVGFAHPHYLRKNIFAHFAAIVIPALTSVRTGSGGDLCYEFVSTLTSSIFFSTEPSSMAFMALSKPSLRLAAFLLM